MWCGGVTAGCSAFAALVALSPHPWPGWHHDLYNGLVTVGGLSLLGLVGTGPPALVAAYRDRRSRKSLGMPTKAPPAQFRQRTIPLHDGLHAGTMLVVEVRAHAQLVDAKVALASITSQPNASKIPAPTRLYWHPGRHESTTIVDGAVGLINVVRVGPFPPGALIDSPDYNLPWSLQDGKWRVELQFTTLGYSAQLISATFSVKSAAGIFNQTAEWVEFAVSTE